MGGNKTFLPLTKQIKIEIRYDPSKYATKYGFSRKRNYNVF